MCFPENFRLRCVRCMKLITQNHADYYARGKANDSATDRSVSFAILMPLRNRAGDYLRRSSPGQRCKNNIGLVGGRRQKPG